jgi:malonate-semialdehyde dehydrogenase (acetylating) / methylmalonate-semialdehyde dehydrogenase
METALTQDRSTATAPRNPVTSAPQIEHFVNGKRFGGSGMRTLNVFNPATGDVVGYVKAATPADVDAAVQAARAAFPAWSQTSAIKRARVLFKFKALLEEHYDELAAMITQQHGKVFSDAQGEVQRGIEVVEFACGVPHLLKGDYTEQIGGGIDNWSMRQPLGGNYPFQFPGDGADVDVSGRHRLREYFRAKAFRTGSGSIAPRRGPV